MRLRRTLCAVKIAGVIFFVPPPYLTNGVVDHCLVDGIAKVSVDIPCVVELDLKSR
jgi:hypothetical protein